MRTQALWFYAVCSNVLNVHSTPWTLEVPQTVSAVKGSCVVVPCKFNYPEPGRKTSDLTGKWHMTNHDHIVYHPEPSKVMGQFRGRTDLVGDLARNNCSLLIKSLEKNDKGPFIFRIEISKLYKYSYTEYQVSIDVQDAPATPMLSVSREVKAGEAVTATCTASHSCPTDLPHLSWSHTGTPIVQSEALPNGQWRVTSNLTFTATPSDHGRHLVCTAQYQQNQKKNEKSLIVKYAPDNVEVETKSTVVKEGDAVKMECSSESNPPAHSYQWYNITGALLSEERIYKLDNVSRHISAFYCAANNTEGHRKSIPVKIRVEYPPRIGVESVCTAKITGVHCRCLVESSPTSRVQWILAGTVVNNSTVNSTGAKDSGTLHTLHLPLGLTDMVSCYASNIHGKDILALQTNQRGVLMAIYLSGSAASAFVLIASISVLWKCSRRKKCVETRNNLYLTSSLSSRDGKRPSKDLCALEVDDDIYVNCGKKHFQDEEEEQHYGNCCQEDIYANM